MTARCVNEINDVTAPHVYSTLHCWKFSREWQRNLQKSNCYSQTACV